MHFLATEICDARYQSQRVYNMHDAKLVCYGTEIMSAFKLLDKCPELSNMNYIKIMFTVRELSQKEFWIQL